MRIRLNKFLSQVGAASRREADKMISEGRVEVNNEVIQELGYKIDGEKDEVKVDGKRVNREKSLAYLMLNKPLGYLVTMKDPYQRPTIKELLPSLKKRIFPVGRLDYDSEGLLLLTNDGELAYRLTHPSFEVKKTYIVKVRGEPDLLKLARLKKGIFLYGKKTAPAQITLLSRDSKGALLKTEIHEGRKREVKRMFETIGHKVVSLKRVAFGGLTLGKLKPGEWRFLTQKEVEELKSKV